jgi:putative ABC transport system permease protein
LSAAPWWRWLAVGQWRTGPTRALVSVLAVAIGVALALAIHLVNASALAEFRQAIATVNGDAHAQVRARLEWLDESLYPAVVRAALAEDGGRATGLAAASPVLETEIVPVRPPHEAPVALRLIGLDPLAAAGVTPALLPAPESGTGTASALFDPDAIFLSQAALQSLDRRVGDPLEIRMGLSTITLQIAGTVPGAAPGQRLAVMDLGTAQWRLDLVGRLSRIDLRFDEGADAAAIERRIAAMLPAQAVWSTPQAGEQRMSNLSRAYRVNLNVLALVALFTGAFLVFATMALAVVRQQPELALLGVLGATRRELLGAVLAQGAALGLAGAAVGVALGIALAAGLLQAVGGDLGGGYFTGSRPRIVLELPAIAGFGLLGVLVGLGGAAAPAWAASRITPARALKSGSGEETLASLGRWRWALGLAAAGALMLLAPPLGGLPIGAYLAIATWLVAGIACVPLLTRVVAAALHRVADRMLWRHPPSWLAMTRIARSPGTVAAALSGVVAAFALSVAMGIMVSSFRSSVAQWLDAVLPADLYARAASTRADALTPALQRDIAATPGVARTEFLKVLDLTLDSTRPQVALIVRSLDRDAPQRQLPLTGPVLAAPAGTIPVWVSEAMVDLYRMRPGDRIELPIGAAEAAGAAEAGGAAEPNYFVAGVWRDYARQHGAIVIASADHERLTGDTGMSDVSVWLAPQADARTVIDQIGRRNPALAGLGWRSATDIRALSLRIFDRSFAVTYALEAIAILVALFGVATASAGEALARAKEFGMLRHVGVKARQIAAQLAIESAFGVTVAVAWGAVIGAAIGIVLIERVNPQSFHWTMDIHWPIGLIAGSALVLILASVIAALLAVRSALGNGPLHAVRQDW